MGIEVKEVVTGCDLDRFVKFPWRIYLADPAWVPPLIAERREHLSRKKNPFFEYGKAAYFLALRDGEPVGRISAHVSRLHNERYQDKVGFFGFFESVDVPEVAAALLGRAEAWLTAEGKEVARGPMSFTINDEVGLLVEGFDTPPKIMMPHTAPYYPKLLEGCGYAKVKELFAWDYDCGRDIPEMAQKIADRVRGMEGLTIRSVDLSKAEEEVAIIMEIFNEAWSRNWGFVPFTQKELSKLAKDLKLILDPRLALIAEYQGKPIAISIAFPDLNQMIKDLNGRLCPWRLLKLLYRVKFHKYTDARLVLLGIKREHRKGPLAGLSVLLYSEMHRRGREMGLRGGELGWTLEDNDKINKGIELMGGRVYKRYRVYEKTL